MPGQREKGQEVWKETYTEYFRVWKGTVTRLDFMPSVTRYR